MIPVSVVVAKAAMRDLLAAELLRLAKVFVEDGVHPQVIIRGYRQAGALAVARLKEIAVGVA